MAGFNSVTILLEFQTFIKKTRCFIVLDAPEPASSSGIQR